MARPIVIVLAVLIVAASFALRVNNLGLPNLTGDEWFMLRNHDQGLAWILHQAHVFEPHPLIYYVGLAGWIEVAGRSEFAMRFPSVIAGVVLTVTSIGLGRALIGDRAGLLVGAIVALNPYQIAESRNARNYAMVTAASAIASLLFLRALSRGRRSDWAFYGLAMIVALNIHYDAALVLAVHVAFVVVAWLGKGLAGVFDFGSQPIVVKRRFPTWWLQTTAVIVVVFAIWLAYAWPALVAYNGYFPTPVGLDRVLGRSLATFSLGAVAAIRDAIPAFALAVIGLAWLFLARRSSALFLGLYTLLPILAVGILFLARPMFDERYLIVLAPG
ncbi:MAG TPA: glycosyltransferase family 39 protein, partial [Chloroflexota bacterium]|nr:glycosyltransferase family 39 protein [Chloroflexota bacterium]